MKKSDVCCSFGYDKEREEQFKCDSMNNERLSDLLYNALCGLEEYNVFENTEELLNYLDMTSDEYNRLMGEQ